MTAWLIERTLARPRDLVLFANMALEQALSSGSIHTPITTEHVRAVERQFSDQKLGDLVAELSVEWPGSKGIFERFRLRPFSFSLEELDRFLAEILGTSEIEIISSFRDVDSLKKWLYQVGFLCFTKKGGALRGTRVIHSGIERQADEFMAASKIFVSPIFRSALQMRDRKASGTVELIEGEDD